MKSTPNRASWCAMALELLSYGLLTFVLIDIDSLNWTVLALASIIELLLKIVMPQNICALELFRRLSSVTTSRSP